MDNKFGYQVGSNGNLILDENNNPIPKEAADVRDFPRSNVFAQEVSGMVEKIRCEVLRRSGFKMKADGTPALDSNGNPIPLYNERVGLNGEPILDSQGNVIPLGRGKVSGPILKNLDEYDKNEFKVNTNKVAEGKKIITETGNQLLDRLIYICELFDRRMGRRRNRGIRSAGFAGGERDFADQSAG